MQAALNFDDPALETINLREEASPFSSQLLKWIGSKQRQAPGIIARFPERFGTYFEPFLGAGGVLGTLSPRVAEASDCFGPLIEIWKTLKANPEELVHWYAVRWQMMKLEGKVAAYEFIKANYNRSANGPDFLFLTRSCYGGVIRFRKHDGYMSTPCGPHEPISPDSFRKRVVDWRDRVKGADFYHRDYRDAFARAGPGDLIYCDPPYSHSQAILYGAQAFSLDDLYEEISRAKHRGVFVALSIDGSKRSGDLDCDVGIPKGLFEREEIVDVGRSMLRRFQLEGQSLEAEHVTDRLLLTF
jgi:DNA adenine methylase